MPATLFVVSTPIGNLEDITLRALRTLREVAVIAAEDTRRTGHLLQHFEIRTPMVSLHEHNERDRTPALLARLQAGESIALVSDAGTPLLSDPGFHLVREALNAGIPVQSVPGPSSVTAALAVSGLPVDRFTFVGFPPARSGQRGAFFAGLTGQAGTLVLFEAPQRIALDARRRADAPGRARGRARAGADEDSRNRVARLDFRAAGGHSRGARRVCSSGIRPTAETWMSLNSPSADAELRKNLGV